MFINNYSDTNYNPKNQLKSTNQASIIIGHFNTSMIVCCYKLNWKENITSLLHAANNVIFDGTEQILAGGPVQS